MHVSVIGQIVGMEVQALQYDVFWLIARPDSIMVPKIRTGG